MSETDSRERAVLAIEAACGSTGAVKAQAWATLYVGDQLSRIADALTGETEAYITTYDGGRAGP